MLTPVHWIRESHDRSRRQKPFAYVGQTEFYRAPNLQDQVISWVQRQERDHIRILIVPCSVGCEPYTYAMLAANAGIYDSNKTLQIDAFDISENFTRSAKKAIYPYKALDNLPDNMTQYFVGCGERGRVEVVEEIKGRVNILPHSSLHRFKAEELYDVVISTNLLKYIPDNSEFGKSHNPTRHARQSKQATAITDLCNLTRGLLFINMLEFTVFSFTLPSRPFNPFAEAGMKYLDADLNVFKNGAYFPSGLSDVIPCTIDRDGVHALQKCEI